MNLRLVLTVCLLSCTVAGPALALDAAAWDRAMVAAKRQKDQGNYAEAFTQLQKAVIANPERYETYFELAIVSYRMGNLGAAEEYARLAQQWSPNAQQESIREMLAVIAEKRDFERLERGGDEAYAKGLMAKAAESYRKAYRLFPKQGRVGLRAAAIFAEMPGRLLDAAALWNEVAEKGDEASAAAAEQELARAAEELSLLFRERMAVLPEWKRAGNTAELMRLAEAFPRRPEPQLELAGIFAQKREVEEAIRYLGQAVRLGVKSPTVRDRPEFQALLVPSNPSPEFTQFIEDAFGAEVLSSMRGSARDLERRVQREQEEAAAERERIRKLKLFAGRWEASPTNRGYERQKDIIISVTDSGEVSFRFDSGQASNVAKRKCRVDDDMIKCVDQKSDSEGSYEAYNHFFMKEQDPNKLYRNLSVAPPTWGRSEYRRVE